MRLAAWALAYAGSVALVVAFTAGRPGILAPVLLATALPAALALSRLRQDVAFACWIVAVMPIAVRLWLLSGGDHRLATMLTLVGAAGLAVFAMAAPKSKAWKPLSALGVAVCLVAYLSSGHGGSGSMIQWFVDRGLNADQAYAATLVFRKTVHFTFYGAVGWTALQAARASGSTRNEAVRTALLAALSLAAFDELRQSSFANRTGSLGDALLDLAGASTFVGLSVWRSRGRR